MKLAELTRLRRPALLAAFERGGLDGLVAGCAIMAAEGLTPSFIAAAFSVSPAVVEVTLGLWIVEAAKLEARP